MLTYLLKRLLHFIPTLLLISMLAFGLSKCTPGDPVDVLNPSNALDISTETEADYYERSYRSTAEAYGLDLPNFYFSLTAKAYPDTLHHYIRKDRRTALRKLTAQHGNWPAIEQYYESLKTLDRQLLRVPDSLYSDAFIAIRSATKLLYVQYQSPIIQNQIDTIAQKLDGDPALQVYLASGFRQMKTGFEQVLQQPTRHLLYIPALHWYGLRNQYHRWVSNFAIGSFGTSHLDGRPVATKIKEAVGWTLLLNLLALLLVFAFSIPIGVKAAVQQGSRFDRWSSIIVFGLYSLPSFWIATLLVVFFTTSEYGMKLFASIGLGDVPFDASLWDHIRIRTPHLILPVVCLTYASFAFLSRQMRGGMLEVMHQDYIRTAWAKGLDQKTVHWKHGFRNAVSPVITYVAAILPAMISGSVIVEVIFNIPGMGRLAFRSIQNEDWPVVFTILMLGALLTIIGILLGDILYKKADPRVGYQKTNS